MLVIFFLFCLPKVSPFSFIHDPSRNGVKSHPKIDTVHLATNPWAKRRHIIFFVPLVNRPGNPPFHWHKCHMQAQKIGIRKGRIYWRPIRTVIQNLAEDRPFLFALFTYVPGKERQWGEMCQFPITDKNHLFLHACFNGSQMCNMHVNITVRGGFLALEHDVAAELPPKKGRRVFFKKGGTHQRGLIEFWWTGHIPITWWEGALNFPPIIHLPITIKLLYI